MRALITRPREDAAGLVAELAARGIESLLAPMLEIAFIADPGWSLDGIAGLLFTSANGVRAFAAASPARDLPVYAVGDSTARTARDAGFSQVASAGGDVEKLAALVASLRRPADGALLHVAASVVAGDLSGRLAELGFTLRRAVLYESRPVTALAPEAAAALAGGGLNIALFFSPRTAATFVTVVLAAGLGDACREMTALCLSPAVAEKIARLPWRRILIADRPDQAGLLARLDARKDAQEPETGAGTDA